MNDPRALYAAILAGLAIIASSVLAALGEATAAASMGGLASSALLYVIGLHSQPHDPRIADVDVLGEDEAEMARAYADPVDQADDELDASKEA